MIQIDSEGRYYLVFNITLASGNVLKTRYYREINSDADWIYLIAEKGELMGVRRQEFPHMIQEIARAWLRTPRLLTSPKDTADRLQGMTYQLGPGSPLDAIHKGDYRFADSVRDLLHVAVAALEAGAVYFEDHIDEQDGVFEYTIRFSPKEESL